MVKIIIRHSDNVTTLCMRASYYDDETSSSHKEGAIMNMKANDMCGPSKKLEAWLKTLGVVLETYLVAQLHILYLQEENTVCMRRGLDAIAHSNHLIVRCQQKPLILVKPGDLGGHRRGLRLALEGDI